MEVGVDFLLKKDKIIKADVAKLVEALDLGSNGETRVGSSPTVRTIKNRL